jgi:hypothetical protein
MRSDWMGCDDGRKYTGLMEGNPRTILATMVSNSRIQVYIGRAC